MNRNEWLMIAAKVQLAPPVDRFDPAMERMIVDCAIGLIRHGKPLDNDDKKRLRKALKRLGVL